MSGCQGSKTSSAGSRKVDNTTPYGIGRSSMKITTIGAGNGGKALAADMTLAGHEVTLFEFPKFKANIEPIIKRGGIDLVGVGRNGFAGLHAITTDIEEALHNSEMIVKQKEKTG